MATTLDPCGCGEGTAASASDALLPAAPFTAMQYHFGMLLGVDDLETAQAYPRGKVRLHNAWLHREGVVWGLDVRFTTRRELSVTPGLALDAAGRELHLDAVACVDLGKWYAAHAEDPDFTFADVPNGKRFDAHVVARFRACPSRPVPSIADPCAGSERDTAYSRVTETVELLLRPGLAPATDRGYHRLRVLFALEPDSTAFAEVQARRAAILAMPSGEQPAAYLAAFREFAALDEIDLRPQADETGAAASIVPEEPTEVVLADVAGIIVRNGTNGWTVAEPLPAPNVRVRPSHVATATIQELLCGPLFASGAAGEASPAPPPIPDAGGPRVDPATVKITGRRKIVLGVNKPLDRESVRPSQFSVTAYTRSDGWHTLDLTNAFPDAAGTLVTIDLKETMTTGSTIRLIARGTGPTPLLGADLVPLAGTLTDPPSGPNDGRDVVLMLRRS